MVDVLDENLQTFIDSHIDSLLAWDVILFLYHNSAKVGNISDLANHFGRSPGEVGRVLSRLRSKGLMQDSGSTEKADLILANSFKKDVEPFIAALSQRQLRLAILADVLKREYASAQEGTINPAFPQIP